MAPESQGCCEVCRSWVADFDHFACNSINSITKSAQAGCLSCQFMLDVLRLDTELSKGQKDLILATTICGRWYSVSDSQGVNFTLHHKTDDILAVDAVTPPERSKKLGISLANLGFAESAFEGVSLAIAESSASAAAFDRARQWLSHCLDNHPRCRPDNEKHLTGPRRLLNLTAVSPHGLQLVDFDGLTTRPEYACLSYRWGDDIEGVLTTTRQNVDEHLVGICEQRLPSAITDAIRVCRELGIHYLWVDSLCILQQDELDFAMEGSKMDTIYANSHLTIYAKHTNSCNDGFLGPQLHGQPKWQYLAPFPTPKGLPFFIRKGSFSQEPFPLDSRGWCLQESMLPSRQLLYTGEEMVWRCNTCVFCECGHIVGHELEDRSEDNDHRYASHFLKTAWDIPGQYTKTWGKIVEVYSTRSLTNPQDKLAAISGLARRGLPSFSAPNDWYFAGLWNDALPSQLLWSLMNYYDRRHNGNSIYGQRLLNGTPTWSWGSVQGGLDFSYALDSPSAQTTAHIDSISCIPSHPENPLGPTKSGLLVLTAPVLPVRLAFPNTLAFQNTFEILSWPDVTLVSPANRNCPLRTGPVSLDIEQTMHGSTEYCQRIPRDALPPTYDGCTCKRHLSSKPYLACGIRLATKQRKVLDKYHLSWTMHFILLEETPHKGTYARVGLVTGEMLPMVDGEDPVGGGVGTQKFFWGTVHPNGFHWADYHEPNIETLLQGQKRVEPWPSKIELEWRQVRII